MGNCALYCNECTTSKFRHKRAFLTVDSNRFFQVLILKLNKEAPYRKDVFRAPGHQGAMKKLIHFLQTGRLVNMDNFSVYTIASVLKKFLRKVPGGIFGRHIEQKFFEIFEQEPEEQAQRDEIYRYVNCQIKGVNC